VSTLHITKKYWYFFLFYLVWHLSLSPFLNAVKFQSNRSKLEDLKTCTCMEWIPVLLSNIVCHCLTTSKLT